jgi:hypothetical protein
MRNKIITIIDNTNSKIGRRLWGAIWIQLEAVQAGASAAKKNESNYKEDKQ